MIVLERDVHGVSPHFTIPTNRRVESLCPLASRQCSEFLTSLPFPCSHSRTFLALHGLFVKHRMRASSLL